MCIYTVKNQILKKNPLKEFSFQKYCKNSIKIFFLYFKNICENNFYIVKRELPTGKDTIFYMPKSGLVFAVSFTPETPNYGTFSGVAHPP